jgi:hypothetical protein
VNSNNNNNNNYQQNRNNNNDYAVQNYGSAYTKQETSDYNSQNSALNDLQKEVTTNLINILQ